MKILVVGTGREGSIGWCCARALSRLGHEVTFFDYREEAYGRRGYLTPRLWRKLIFPQFIVEKFVRLMNNRLINVARTIKPALVLVSKGELLYPQTIEEIKRQTLATTVVWHTDSPFTALCSNRKVITALCRYDLCCVFDPWYVPEILRHGASRAVYLPVGCDPAIHRRMEVSQRDKRIYGSDVCFVGNLQTHISPRRKILAAISDFDLKIWGVSWKALRDDRLRSRIVGRSVYGDEYAKVYSASKIALNVHHPQCIKALNPRTFEVTACGCLLVTDVMAELPKFFEPGKEVVTFQEIEELRDKLRFFLKNERARRKVADAGMKRALSEHTYDARMQKLLEVAFG